MSRPYDDYSSEPPRPRRDDYDRDYRRRDDDDRDYRRRDDDYDRYDRDRDRDRDYERGRYDDRDYGLRRRRGSPLASRWARLGAHLIDGFFFLMASVPGFLVLFLVAGNSRNRFGPSVEEVLIMIAAFVLCIGGLWVYNMVLLSNYGYSGGKKLVGIRIVRYDDEKNPGFVGAVLLRSWVNAFIGAVPYIGGLYSLVDICCIFGEEKRCIHDMLANTKVIVADPMPGQY